MDLWKKIHGCFDTDDGSLPGVFLTGLTGDQVVSSYKFLRSISGPLCGHDSDQPPIFWNKILEKDIPVDSVPNAAELVVKDLADQFCVWMSEVVFDGVPLPELGCIVCPDQIEVCYRMGKEWDAVKVSAFFQIIRRLTEIAPAYKFEFDGYPNPKLFLDTWSEFINHHRPLTARLN